MSETTETQVPESSAAETTESSTEATTEKGSEESGSNLNDLTSDKNQEGGDSWYGGNEDESGDREKDSNNESKTESDSESETENKSDSDSETETETETVSVSSTDDVKKLITDNQPIPDGTDENLVKAARAELLLEESKAETAKLRSYLNQNPAELFTEEQKSELDEILNTKGADAYYERRKEIEKQVVDARLNDPAFKEKSQAVSNQETYTKFLGDNGISHENFKAARMAADVEAFNKKEITLDEFLKRTHASYNRMTKNIHKGDTPPKIVKGTTSKSTGPKGKDSWFDA